jgi:hypothetical protein
MMRPRYGGGGVTRRSLGSEREGERSKTRLPGRLRIIPARFEPSGAEEKYAFPYRLRTIFYGVATYVAVERGGTCT